MKLDSFSDSQPLLQQLTQRGLEFDQKLRRALEVCASKPDVEPEDSGLLDSYITLSLYRLNSTLTQLVDLDDFRYNLFHEYKLAPSCPPDEVVPGHKLCSVLTKAAELAAPSKSIGSGHYLKAVAALTLDKEAWQIPMFGSQVIHNTFSAETLLWGLGHTAWTPVEEAPELRDILSALDGRNLIDDFQYFISLEDKRLVFRPISKLDSFAMERNDGLTTDRLAVLTHLRDGYSAVTPDELLEFEDILNNPRVKEHDLQRFFETHRQFLRIWDFREVFPQVYLTREDEGPLIPDFLLLDKEINKAMIVDLKLPNAKTVVKKKNRERFSALIEEARAQLLEYRDWFEDTHNRREIKKFFGIEIFRPRLGVVIGSSSEFSSPYQRQKIVSRYPDVEIATYDDIMIHAQRRLALVKSAVRSPSALDP